MRDCDNAELRDLLPDLLHDRLSPDARARVSGHLSSCASCQAELALLTRVRDSAPAVLVDAGPIVGAIRPYARSATPRARGLAPWMAIAASIVLLVGMGGVWLRASRTQNVPPVAVNVPVNDTPRAVAVVGATSQAAPGKTIAGRAPAELDVGGALGDLSESDLRALISELGSIEAVPTTDPEVVVPAVNRSGT